MSLYGDRTDNTSYNVNGKNRLQYNAVSAHIRGIPFEAIGLVVAALAQNYARIEVTRVDDLTTGEEAKVQE